MAGVDNMQASGLTPPNERLDARAMNKLILTLGLTAALAACNNEDHNIVADSVPDDGYNAAAEGNVVLPPAIQASKTYRCADNTIVHIDWLADGKSATVRPEGGATIAVAAAEPGAAMTGPDGSTVSGGSSASSVKISLGGKPAKSCNG